MAHDTVVNGSSVVELGFLYDFQLTQGKWWRSKEKKGGMNPFASFMMNKKWTLEEEFNNHMMRFQQVKQKLWFIKLNFISTFKAGLAVIGPEPEDDQPEPLRMEHFLLPIGMWCVGILISLFCFLAEIISHRIRKIWARGLTQHRHQDIEDTEETEVVPN